MESQNTKLLLIAFVITLAASGLALGQDSVGLSVSPSALRALETGGIDSGAIATGQKLKIEGTVINQNDQSFTLRDGQGSEPVVVVTKKTLIQKKHKGWFYGPKTSSADEIRCGLRLKVEGQGNSDGQVVAKNITIEEPDSKAAKESQARVGFFEEPARSRQVLAERVDQPDQNGIVLWTIPTTQWCGKCGHTCGESCATSGCHGQGGCN